ncbi:DUF1413 domain-containing protein [Lactococcus garvieae]|uniref:DUF1413 domain-containing protein n=1 Tax=Lactococcus garvieae TaxID=1363 RepID=UPI001CE35EDE|nr:DUF1413 domain-containing protein [Lactococcus garvieae]
MKSSDILDEAKFVINRLKPGVQFKLKDLFRGVDWSGFDKSARLSAGGDFKSEVETGSLINLVEYTGKTSSNSALYVRI